MTALHEKIAKALQEDAEFLQFLGGCTDGGCIIQRPKGMHTNGGCKCHKNEIKMFRLASAHQKFIKAVTTALQESMS